MGIELDTKNAEKTITTRKHNTKLANVKKILRKLYLLEQPTNFHSRTVFFAIFRMQGT